MPPERTASAPFAVGIHLRAGDKTHTLRCWGGVFSPWYKAGVRSMTGYGRGTAEEQNYRMVVEMRSVNHRYLDLKVRGASVDAVAEEKITKLAKGRLARGSVVVSVRVSGGPNEQGIRLDPIAARRAYEELSTLRRHIPELAEDSPSISLAFLCSQPGVLVQNDTERDPAIIASCAERAATECLDALVAMREAEGSALKKDVETRLSRLEEIAQAVHGHVEAAPAAAQKRLHERLEKLLADTGTRIDEDRLAHEIALLADRLDVTEELVRVKSHVAQARGMMAKADKAIGRRLDFLVQELGREFNTITSKSQSADIAGLVVEGKAELERIREQVQNIE